VSYALDILRDAYGQAGYRLLLLLLLMLLVGLTDGVSMALIYPLLEVVGVGAAPGSDPGMLGAAFRHVFALIGVTPTLTSVSVLLIGSFLMQLLLLTTQNWLLIDIQKKYIARRQRDVFADLMRSEWAYFSSQKVGELANVIIVEVVRLGAALFALLQLITAGIVLCVYLALSLFISWKVTLCLLAAGLALFVIVRPIRTATRRYGAEASEINAGLATTLNELFSGAKLIKATATEDRADKLMFDHTERMRNNLTWGAFLPTTIRGIFEFAAILMILGALIWSTQVEMVSAAQVLVVMALLARLFPRLVHIQQFHNALNLYGPAFAALHKLRSRAAAQSEWLRPHWTGTVDAGGILPADISAKDLVVRHGDATVLDRISFVIPHGQVVGLVGPSGAGKSTLVDTIVGLVVPTDGVIRIGDVRLQDVDLRTWRRRIGYVSQDTFLFHDTIANNIRWAEPEAPIESVLGAARAAGLDRFVTSLDRGYDTVVGDRGIRLSGGQRQRISLARVLLRRPEVLILDEATSALDSLSEQEVMAVLNTLRGRATILIVAHRLAAVRDADLIYVLDHGRIIEHGSWDRLSGQRALFHRLLQAQAVGEQG